MNNTSTGLLPPQTAREVIDHGLFLGADFVDLFVEKAQRQRISILSSKVEDISGGLDFGVGVRLVFGHQVLYGYTNSTDKEELKRIATQLATGRSSASSNKTTAVNFSHPVNGHKHPVLSPLEGASSSQIPLDAKVSWLLEVDRHTRALSPLIVQVSSNAAQKRQWIEVFNSEGLYATDERNYCRVSVQAIARDGKNQSSGYEGPGALQGWEFVQSLNPQSLGEKTGKLALTKLTAGACPAGYMPVIIDNGFGGVIFHEACGHLLETTSVAKKASVFHDKLDQPIANECVSAVDDGILENQWGSLGVDDEGMPTQKTQLIKNGILTSFMVDRMGAIETGYARTGSGRKESYRYAPASRMRNTFIEPGPHSLGEMISTVEKGIYCKKMGGGSVSPGTGEFNFSAEETYLIEKGKVTKPLKSATLVGSGPEVLKQISMVGNNFALAAGMCGSISGSIPASVGQAAIKVDKILVGGQS